MRYLLLTLLILGCGAHKALAPSNIPTSLEDKATLYVQLLKESNLQDQYGFILTNTCDSLLFSGLLGAALPGEVKIDAAEQNGQWFRRPAQDCQPSAGNSHSTISRDMITGLMWHMWRNRQLDMANELMQTLQKNSYVLLGEGTPGDLVMTTTLIQTLAEMIFKLGGPNYVAERNLPAIFSPEDIGFVAHLAMWHILLRGEVFGSISSLEQLVIQTQVKRQPTNPLFVAASHRYSDGDFTEVNTLLMNASQWPSSRLPSNAEHCDVWPIQRDSSDKGWQPCSPSSELHTGAELPAIFYLIVKGK